MPNADYRCPGCPGIIVNKVYPMAAGAIASAPVCPVCECLMEWIPMARFDLRTDGGEGKSFQKFSVFQQVPTKEGLVQREVEIDSLHKLRQVERDSEQRFRNGEGEALRFRMANQDASNKLENSFGREGRIGDQTYDSGQQPRRSGKVTPKRHGTKKPKIAVARGGGVSALKG